LSAFNDIKQSESYKLRGPEGRGFHGRTRKLAVPYSDKRPAPMEFSFRVGHDGPLENAIIDYRLQILPIFIKFDSNDQLVAPIDRPSEEAIAAWINDKLVEFTQTYFEVYFNDEYQKTSLEMDPVMNVRFPKAYAAGKKECQRRAYHFFTKESLQLFEKDPSAYIESV
jgi:YHS domain-containing protein